MKKQRKNGTGYFQKILPYFLVEEIVEKT